MRFRFSLAALVVVVAFCGVGFAALRNANQFWSDAIFTLTAAALCTTTYLALYRRGAWAAFAIVGWASLILSFVRPENGPELLTTTAIDRLHSYISDQRATQPINGLGSEWSHDRPSIIDGAMIRYVRVRDDGVSGTDYVPYYYRQVGQSLMSLALAGVGALLAHLVTPREAEARRQAL
jgi:hypothetical protein